MNDATKPANRVWIELEKPRDAEHADEVCALVNNMLRKLLGGDGDTDRGFFWSTRESRYAYGGPMGYTILRDNGEWFDLDYLGRED